MNICFVSMEYPPETGWGGIGTYTYNTAHAIANLGHEVHVVAQAIGTPSDYMDGKVHVHRIKPKSVPSPFLGGAVHRLAYSFQVYRKIKSIDCEFDIVEAPEWCAEGFIQSFSNSLPLITRLHTPLFLIKHLLNEKFDASAKAIDFLEKTQTKNSHGITSPSAALVRKVSEYWDIDSSRIKVIPNGIDIEKIKSIKVKPLAVDFDYLLYIGKLEPRKGVHILARALPKVFEQYPNLKMVFVGSDGSGTMKDFILNVNRDYRKNLIFPGFVSDEEKYSWIKFCKLVILPSLWENFPYTCLEAMALGKAVIATKGSGYDEIIEDGISGVLVEPGNFRALQDKIIECLVDENRIKILEYNSQKQDRQFDTENVSKKLLNYYKEII
jgi:glycosyltransferase involved in cell wall biosynthesis